MAIVSQVALASEEQATAAEQISVNIEGITNVTHESAAGVQQIARAAEDLMRLTVDLQGMVTRFKIYESSDHSEPDAVQSKNLERPAVRPKRKVTHF